MLIYYRFNNFCSFNCDSEFSMSAPTGKVKSVFRITLLRLEKDLIC